MKKIILVSFIVLFIGLVPHVFAASAKFVPLAPITGLTAGIVADSTGLATFFNNLYKYLVGLAAALAVIEIIWGGLEIALNKDDVSKLTDSKGKIYNAILGLILVLSPVLVFSIINPSILNLSLNLPKLEKIAATSATCTLTANVSALTANEAFQLSWSATNFNTFKIINDSNQVIDSADSSNLKGTTSGSLSVTPSSDTTTYTGTVTDGSGNANTCKFPITTTTTLPTCTLTPSLSEVPKGSSVKLSWGTTGGATAFGIINNVNSTTYSAGSSEIISGSKSFSISAATTFTGTVTSAGGYDKCAAAVAVTN